MNRIATCAAALISASLLGCGSGGSPSPLVPPPGCVAPEVNPVRLTVNDQAQVDPPCVVIRMGKTDVIWEGASNVKHLLIAFKNSTVTPPEDPRNDAATCKLEKAKHASKPGDFAYSVIVVRQDGSTRVEDPRLIIQP